MSAGTNAGANAGESFGQKFKDGIHVIKGAGDVVRGEINSFVDNAGDGIAGRSAEQRPPTETDGGRRPETVTQQGKAEMEAGLQGLER